jgi:hypothetical protein
MRKAILSVATAIAAVAAASSAQAITFTQVAPNEYSAFFGATHTAGGFDDEYSFDLSGFALTSLTLSAALNSTSSSNITFSSILFNGSPLAPTASTSNTYFEFQDVILGGGPNTITVSGEGAGSYSGTIRYVLADQGGNPAGAVPEPMSWAMMVGGFGVMGGALRMNRRRKVSVSFA